MIYTHNTLDETPKTATQFREIRTKGQFSSHVTNSRHNDVIISNRGDVSSWLWYCVIEMSKQINK